MSSAQAIQWVGNGDLLKARGIAFLASTRVPPDLWLPTLDLVAALAKSRKPLIGGFHSPLERDGYEVALLAGGAVVRISAIPASGGAFSKLERSALQEGRFLLLSPLDGERRITARATQLRTQRVLQFAHALFLPAAPSRGRTYQAAADAPATGLPAFCFDHPRNTDLQILGVLGLVPGTAPAQLARVISGGSLP